MTQLATTTFRKTTNPWAQAIRVALERDVDAQELRVACLFCDWERTGPARDFVDGSGRLRHGVLYWQVRHSTTSNCRRKRDRKRAA